MLEGVAELQSVFGECTETCEMHLRIRTDAPTPALTSEGDSMAVREESKTPAGQSRALRAQPTGPEPARSRKYLMEVSDRYVSDDLGLSIRWGRLEASSLVAIFPSNKG